MPRSSSQHQDLLVAGLTQTRREALSTVANGAVPAVRSSHTTPRRRSGAGAVPAVRVSAYLGKASSHRGAVPLGSSFTCNRIPRGVVSPRHLSTSITFLLGGGSVGHAKEASLILGHQRSENRSGSEGWGEGMAAVTALNHGALSGPNCCSQSPHGLSPRLTQTTFPSLHARFLSLGHSYSSGQG